METSNIIDLGEPFTLEAWEANPYDKKIFTRDGRAADILCTNLRGDAPLAVCVHEKNYDQLFYYKTDGSLLVSGERCEDYDLFMIPCDTSTHLLVKSDEKILVNLTANSIISKAQAAAIVANIPGFSEFTPVELFYY